MNGAQVFQDLVEVGALATLLTDQVLGTLQLLEQYLERATPSLDRLELQPPYDSFGDARLVLALVRSAQHNLRLLNADLLALIRLLTVVVIPALEEQVAEAEARPPQPVTSDPFNPTGYGTRASPGARGQKSSLWRTF